MLKIKNYLSNFVKIKFSLAKGLRPYNKIHRKIQLNSILYRCLVHITGDDLVEGTNLVSKLVKYLSGNYLVHTVYDGHSRYSYNIVRNGKGVKTTR